MGTTNKNITPKTILGGNKMTDIWYQGFKVKNMYISHQMDDKITLEFDSEDGRISIPLLIKVTKMEKGGI